MRTRNPFVPAAIVAAITIASLAGCSSTGNTNYVSSHTPKSSSSSDAGSGSGSGSDSGQKSEALPSDFPKDAVPLVDGTILVARGDKDNGWSVTVQPSGKGGFADAQSALKGKGYTEQPGATDKKAAYTNGTYTVALSTPGVSVTYAVTANQ